MIQFRKKAPAPAPAWHPDFRDPLTLPDVKPVRTAFFVNGVAVLIMSVVALFLAFQEYGRNALRQEIALMEQNIQEHTARNNEVLKLHRAFQAEERYVKEVSEYAGSALPVSELLISLSETRHPDIIFSVVRYQDLTARNRVAGKELLINGAIKAPTSEAAASAITEYLNVFQEHPFLTRIVENAVPTSLVPMPDGERMGFGIQLTLKPWNEEQKGEAK